MQKKKLIIASLSFLILFYVANIGAVNAFDIPTLPISAAKTFDAEMRADYREQIDRQEPEVIILGDSSISFLNAEIVSDLLGKKTMVFAFPGTGSAYWYLFIRNQLFLAKHRPQYFILFFRDSTLTAPTYRVQGEYLIRLEEMASDWDEDVYQLAINAPKPEIMQVLEAYIPLLAYRMDIYAAFIEFSRGFLPFIIFQSSEKDLNSEYESVFERERINDQLWEVELRNQDISLYSQEALNFSGNVYRSFLPAIIRDLRMMGIKPIFVRAKYRSHAAGDADSQMLSRYMKDITQFFKEENLIYTDLSTEKGLTVDMFEDNFHIRPTASDSASHIVAVDLLKLLD